MINTRDHDCTGTVCNPERFPFPAVKKRKVTASFSGGEVSSDGGILWLRQADRQVGLTQALAGVLPDPRNPERIVHPLRTFIRQRVYGLCLGYEDLNDHDSLRQDLAWQSAAERDEALASSPTLCRWENRADRQVAWLVQEILVNPCLFSDRTSCHDWWANPFRLRLSSCAYVLLETVRRLGLAGTDLARAPAGTLRLKLLKIGAVVLRNTRRGRLLLASSYPYQNIFAQVAKVFSTG